MAGDVFISEIHKILDQKVAIEDYGRGIIGDCNTEVIWAECASPFAVGGPMPHLCHIEE